MTAPNKMAKRAAAGTLALAVCFTGGVLSAGAAQAAAGFKFDQRISGADRTATSVAAAEARAQCGASDTVIIVERDAVVDGLTASYVAGTNKAPILYVDRQGVPDNVAAEIKKLGATKAILVGGTAVLPQAVKTQLESSGLTVTRLSGPDRYATAAAVALSGSKTPDKVLVASGEVPADALAAGPIAYAENYPLVLVRPDSVPDSTQGALNQLGSGERLAIGGTVRISDSVYNSLGDSKRRVSGPNRQATAIALANIATGELGFEKDRVALVSNMDRSAVDALVASPVAGCNLAPLLFTNGADLGAETTKYLQDHAGDLTGPGYVFGGTTAVPQSVADQGTAAAGGDGTTPPVTPPPTTGNGLIVTGSTANTVTYAVPESKSSKTENFSAADKFTVDGADASIGGFRAALTGGDRLVVTRKDDNTATFALTNVKVESGLLGSADTTNGDFTIVDPVTGQPINTAPEAPKNYFSSGAGTGATGGQEFVTYSLDGANVDRATFEASLNAGDTITVTGGDGQTTQRPRNFGLTNQTVTGSIQTIVDPTTDPVQIETPAGATFLFDISGATAQSITVDGNAATLEQVRQALSIGDAVTYTRVNNAVSFTLTNAAPQSITATVTDGSADPTIEYYAAGDGTKTRTVDVPTDDNLNTFKVDGQVVSRGTFFDSLTAGDSVTFLRADPQKTTDKSSFMVTNVALSGKIQSAAAAQAADDAGTGTATPAGGTTVNLLLGNSRDQVLATVDFSNPADPYVGNTEVQYFVNGDVKNITDFTTAIDDVKTESTTGTLTLTDNGSTTEYRLVSTDAAGKPVSVATPATNAVTLAVTFNNPVYLKGAVDSGDFVIKRIAADGTETAVSYKGATPQTSASASKTVTLSVAPVGDFTAAGGAKISVQLTEAGAAKFVDVKGKASTPAIVVSPAA